MVLGLLGRRKSAHSRFDSQQYKDDLAVQGEELIASGNLKDALSCFEAALQLNPSNEYAWGGKALALDYSKRYNEALGCYDNALRYNPENAITWHNRGLTLASLKMLEEAIESFDRAIQINAKYGKAWYNKGRLLEKIGQTESAQHCLNTARKLDPLLFMKLKGR